MGQVPGVAPGLLERGQGDAVRLLGAFAKTHIPALLLDEDAGVPDETVDETGMVQLYGDLKVDVLLRLGHTEDFLQQRQPEGLRLLFFVAAVLPIGGELSGGGPLFPVGHIPVPLSV